MGWRIKSGRDLQAHPELDFSAHFTVFWWFHIFFINIYHNFPIHIISSSPCFYAGNGWKSCHWGFLLVTLLGAFVVLLKMFQFDCRMIIFFPSKPRDILILVEWASKHPLNFTNYPLSFPSHIGSSTFFQLWYWNFDFIDHFNVILDKHGISAPQGSKNHSWSGNEVFLSPCSCFSHVGSFCNVICFIFCH
jgi:hypothetical protein